MKKTYLINKEYLHKLIDELPDTAIVSEDGFMYQVTDGESSEIGKMGKVQEFSIFCPPWAALRIN